MNNSDIDKMIERATSIWNATQVVMDSISDRQRLQIKDIAEAVGLAVGQEPAKVLPYVNDFAHNTSVGYVTRGKFGGFIKGQRPLKVAKVTKTLPAVDSTVDVAADTATDADTSATV